MPYGCCAGVCAISLGEAAGLRRLVHKGWKEGMVLNLASGEALDAGTQAGKRDPEQAGNARAVLRLMDGEVAGGRGGLHEGACILRHGRHNTRAASPP